MQDIPVAEVSIPPINLLAKQLIKELAKIYWSGRHKGWFLYLEKHIPEVYQRLLKLSCIAGCQRKQRMTEARFITMRNGNYCLVSSYILLM